MTRFGKKSKNRITLPVRKQYGSYFVVLTTSKNKIQQECIPVGCVPAER